MKKDWLGSDSKESKWQFTCALRVEITGVRFLWVLISKESNYSELIYVVLYIIALSLI